MGLPKLLPWRLLLHTRLIAGETKRMDNGTRGIYSQSRARERERERYSESAVKAAIHDVVSGDEETCQGARRQSPCAIMENLASRRQNIFNSSHPAPFQGKDNSALTVMLAFSLLTQRGKKRRQQTFMGWFIVRTR